MPQTIGEKPAHQQGGHVPARVTGPSTPSTNTRASPARSARRKRHGLPDRPPSHQLNRLPGRLVPERAIVLDPDRGRPEPRADGTQPGWLVLLGIRNHGLAPVRSADFSVPLAFAFPGRQVLAAWLCDAPQRRRTTARPAVRVPAERGAAPGSGNPGLVLLAGDFLLRPKDACTIAVILSGTPVPGSRPVHRDGTLASGRITSRPYR
jgi:hypothetical protein